MLHKSLQHLVTENYTYAAALHHFGIKFYEYTHLTLAQVCARKGLVTAQVVASLEAYSGALTPPANLPDYPVEVLLQYLSYAHGIFIREKLPYMAQLVADLRAAHPSEQVLVRDLQLLFPLFVEEFIEHIREEEQYFFRYLRLLTQAQQGKISPIKLYFEMERNPIQTFALEHHHHDDEMRGIREMTDEYTLPRGAGLHLQVVFAELKAFEAELINHANIEDELLFVKALQLESQVREHIQKRVLMN